MNINRLLIFDCDGILVDSEGLGNQVFIDHVRELGIPLTKEEVWKHFPGTSLAFCISYVESTYETNLPSDFITVFRERRAETFSAELKPIRGVKRALEQLDGIKCVASNGTIDSMKRNLITTGILDFFDDRLYSAYDINKWKPLPDLFIHAASDLGYRPEQCIVIEDSQSGIQAAINANMRVLAFEEPDTPYSLNLDGIASINNMDQLGTALEALDL